jgi:hypothetical protein
MTHPDLSALARLCDRLACDLPADVLPDLIAALEAGKARALARVVREAIPAPRPALQLVDAAEMARQLNLAETWVRDAARQERIPCVHAGVHLRFDPVAVVEAMKAGTADLPDRSALSERGRKAVGHRIERPVKAAKGVESHGAATALLPRDGAESGAADA